MALRIGKKTSVLLIILLCLVLGGSGGYLLWRTNQPDTVAPTDSDASCKAVCDEGATHRDTGLPHEEGNCLENEKGYEGENGNMWCCTPYSNVCTSVCGDNKCESPETVTSCPKDCADACADLQTQVACEGELQSGLNCDWYTCDGRSWCDNADMTGYCAICGDNQCTGSETISTCPSDCACKPLSWTNKPSGKYPVDTEIPTITITNPNSTSAESAGVDIKLNGTALSECSQGTSTEYCFNVSTNSAGIQVVSINPFKQQNQLKEGTYSLSVSLPGEEDTCSESTSFVIATTTVIPQTGIFDGTMGRIYLGMGFVFLGLLTTQTQKVAYMYNSLSERSRIIQREKEIKIVEKKRNRFEKKFK